MRNVSTFNWDTVFAAPINIINQAINHQQTSPKVFEKYIPADDFIPDATVTGNFDSWEIIPGGSGKIVKMSLPVTDFTYTRSDKPNQPLKIKKLAYHIEVKLVYLTHPEQEKEAITKKQLKIRTYGLSNTDPAVVSTNIIYQNEDVEVDGSGIIPSPEMIKGFVDASLMMWLNEHLDQFVHVFNTVNLNNYIDDEEPWQWARPSYVDYAYSEPIENATCENSVLGVLCMTDGRKGDLQEQAVDAQAIPKGSQSGFLIHEKRLLEEVILPTIPKQFPSTELEDFELHESISDNGFYQYAVRLKADKNIILEEQKQEGITFTPIIEQLEIKLVDQEVQMYTYTRANLPSNASATCETTNFYKIKLSEKRDGKQTLEYVEAREPITVHHEYEGDMPTIIDWIIGIGVALVGIIVGIATGTIGYVVAVVVAFLLAGGLALAYGIAHNINSVDAPSIGMLLDNTTSQVIWNAADVFKIEQAGLVGSLQLGGSLTL
ncbi:TULIP family P47-like protein [Enterococcus faecium]|nr:TULIP family P47-like protein [Enterococcus faecium]